MWLPVRRAPCSALRWCACVLGTKCPCTYDMMWSWSAGRPIDRSIGHHHRKECLSFHHHTQRPGRLYLGSNSRLDPPPAPATSMKDERRATSDQDELRKQGSGRPQAGGERCLRSANSPLGRRCAGENHVFVRLAWIPISVCCLLHHPHFCWLGVAEYM